MDSVTCNPKNGQLYLPIVIHDGDHSYNANYGKIIADNKDPKVDIIQPSSGLYLNNVKFFFLLEIFLMRLLSDLFVFLLISMMKLE